MQALLREELQTEQETCVQSQGNAFMLVLSLGRWLLVDVNRQKFGARTVLSYPKRSSNQHFGSDLLSCFWFFALSLHTLEWPCGEFRPLLLRVLSTGLEPGPHSQQILAISLCFTAATSLEQLYKVCKYSLLVQWPVQMLPFHHLWCSWLQVHTVLEGAWICEQLKVPC